MPNTAPNPTEAAALKLHFPVRTWSEPIYSQNA